jgi:hypothetical protein
MGKLVLLLTAALGPDVGWQPLPDGGFEYVIQFDGQMLDVLRSGQDFTSDIPPDLRGVRRYRITVGSGEVPRTGTPPPPLNPAGVTSPLPLPESESESPKERSPERTASWFEEDSPATKSKETQAEIAEGAGAPTAPDRPWLQALLVIGLLASTSATGYLGWTTWVYRERYGKLLRQLADSQTRPALGDTPEG